MTALSVTPTNVKPDKESVTIEAYEAGEAIDAGEQVYLDTSDNKVYLGNSASSSLTATVQGVAITSAAIGEGVIVQSGGRLKAGATLTAGALYYVGATDGAIIPEADLTTNDYVSAIYRAEDTTWAVLEINVTGILL